MRVKKITGCCYLYAVARADETHYLYLIDGEDEHDEENFSPLGTLEEKPLMKRSQLHSIRVFLQ